LERNYKVRSNKKANYERGLINKLANRPKTANTTEPLGFLTNISTGQTDSELVAAFKQTGNMDLLGMLYQRYMDLVFGVCLKYFKDAERSKDAVMDIYLELGKKLPQHEVAYFKGWLHVLARNHCLMQLRSPRNLKTTELGANFVQSAENGHLDGEVYVKEEKLNTLQKCVEGLPDGQRQAVSLFYLENKCYNEIADLTGYDWNKVRSFIQNGRRNLKICMEQQANGA
jgi:RNA polymerase sigma factor (sigma-70 family)